MLRRVLKVLCAISFVLLGCVALIIVFTPFDGGTGRWGNGWTLLPNIVLTGMALVAVGFALFIYMRFWGGEGMPATRKDTLSDITDSQVVFDRASIVIPICLFVIQLLIIFEAGITTGWDAGGLEDCALLSSEKLARSGFAQEYFSRYPNNLFLLWMLRALNGLREVVLPVANSKAVLASLSCFASCVACFLFMRVAKQLFKNVRNASLATVLYVCLVGLCPWYMIPYTDTLALPFCMAMLWCSVCGTSPWTRFGLFGLCAAVGFAVKPTAIFCFAAIVVTGCLALRSLPPLRKALRYAALVVGGFALGMTITSFASSSLPMPIDEDAQFTVWHYAMMGLNVETDGKYSENDVQFSSSFSSVEERNRMNRQEIGERLANMGGDGLLTLLFRKLLFMYNSGTFSWCGEGNFVVTRRELDNPISRFLVKCMYEDGEYYRVYYTVQQSLWMIVLIGIPLGLLGIRTCGKRLPHVAAMLAAISMLTVFLLIFEVRARYLFLYGGFYVMLAAWGYECLCSTIMRMRNKSAE